MQSFEDIWKNENLKKVLKKNGVAVMPTDTIYGLVGKALSESAVNRIYDIKKRHPEKPSIILISHKDEIKNFNIILTSAQEEKIKEYWSDNSEPVSIVLDCEDESFAYLHRGTKTLAFRVPTLTELRNLLKETGPLIAPSANTEGEPPAKNISEARKYFENKVDIYIDGGEITGTASRVIKLHKDGQIDILRD